MNAPRPIEIVGGGLAGLSLGLALRRHDVPATIHEAGDYPRHRVCGEFIAGLGARTIERLGLDHALDGAVRHEEVAWFAGGRTFYQRLPAPALGLSRHTLDARLAAEFVARGGTLCVRSRAPLDNVAEGVVLAAGRRVAPHSPWLGLKLHARDLPLARGLEVHLGEDCYVGLTPVETGAVNVCGLFRRRPLRQRGPGLLLEYLHAARLPALAERLRRAAIDADSVCAVAAVAFDRRVPAATQIRLGDAAAMIPPFTGNGMAMAFQSAELALNPLLAYARCELTWAETCRATQAALRARFRVRLVSASALHPFLLRSRRQRWLAALSRARLLPYRPLYATLH